MTDNLRERLEALINALKELAFRERPTSTKEAYWYEHIAAVEQAAARIGESEWRDISEAPKDGELLLFAPKRNLSASPLQADEMKVARRADYCWATHFMPLPSPP